MENNPLIRMGNNRRGIHELLRDTLIEPADSDEPICKIEPESAENSVNCDYCLTSIQIGDNMQVIEENEGRRRKYHLHEKCYDLAQKEAERQAGRRG